MERAVELMLGITLLVSGISWFLRSAEWATFLNNLEKQDRQASLKIGTINLLTGSFIVSFHWLLSGISIIVTIIGIIALAKGCLYLIFPAWLPYKLGVLAPKYNDIAKYSGILMILLSLFILANLMSWRQAQTTRIYNRGTLNETIL